MTPKERDYSIGAFCEAAVNQLDHRIMWACVTASTRGAATNCRALDANVQAAIQAAEWLDRVVETYKPTP
jgi:hypothetical protein